MQNAAADSLLESKFKSDWAEAAGLNRCFFYRGASMAPTFRPGQLLWLKTNAASIRPGDILVFFSPSKSYVLAHRVVAESDRGWVTRGDNNSHPDPSAVPSSRVIGRVEMVEEGGRCKKVKRGRFQLWKARLRWAKKGRRLLGHRFGHPYRLLRGSNTVSRLLSALMNKHMITMRLNTEQGPVFKTTYKGRIVARWWPDLDIYYCRKPFDLVLKKPSSEKD